MLILLLQKDDLRLCPFRDIAKEKDSGNRKAQKRQECPLCRGGAKSPARVISNASVETPELEHPLLMTHLSSLINGSRPL